MQIAIDGLMFLLLPAADKAAVSIAIHGFMFFLLPTAADDETAVSIAINYLMFSSVLLAAMGRQCNTPTLAVAPPWCKLG
ncbi:hypothetical protein OB925_15650 [Aeromonas rivipollensis]|uniref:hypothetical protein n=1 Tax=Aeromonas rivipollensis TaxID=948519 RepID=UPI00259EAED1|nr:hypothetical protein [Aeromonas rivipollensis]MDM5086658.1 hypothetical protein [Aeromonas rivipollensis]MDM5098642.1 hypothetical protein [Aeromonas rivipollensis]MDM5107086.1 hypothetical protein [Aeromonas rivipollensis]